MLQNRIENLTNATKDDIKKADAFRMSYNLTLDMAKSILDPRKHRSNIKPTFKDPKLPTETQMLVNLMDWQVKMCCTYN